MQSTVISFPEASMTTALDAPLKGEKLLIASPFVPMKNPLVLPIRDPSLENVLTVKTDFDAFFTHDGWAYNGRKEKKNRSKTPITLLCTLLKFSVLIYFLPFYSFSFKSSFAFWMAASETSLPLNIWAISRIRSSGESIVMLVVVP